MTKETVCLVVPPSIFLLDERVFVNLGVLKVAASLEAVGHPVELLDLSGVSNYEDVAELHVRSSAASIVGITTTTPQMPAAAKILRRMRSVVPSSVRFVVGGPHPTLVHAAARLEVRGGLVGRATHALDQLREMFDVVVAGDGEDAVFEALAHVPDVVSSGGRILGRVVDADDPKGRLFMTNARYEATPSPARHLVDMDSYHYSIEGVRATSVIGQLGCPFACFSAKTKIILSKGSNKKACDVVVGDMLVAMDETTRELTETTVVRKFVHEADETLSIGFVDGRKVECTAEHPFFVGGSWVEARDLKVGDEIYDITWKDKMRVKMRLHNPVVIEHVKEKISSTVTRRHEQGVFSYEHLRSVERRERMRHDNPFKSDAVREASRKRMIANNPMENRSIVEKVRRTMVNKVSRGEFQYYMRTPEYWEKLKKKLNGHEKAVAVLLEEEFGDRFKFVGDGKKRIEWYSPDFIDEEHKKIVEYNGCWWHGCRRCFPDKEGPRRRDAHRNDVFVRNGYKVFTLWTCDLADRRDETLGRLRSFVWNGAAIASIEVVQKKVTVYNYECSPYNNYFAEYLLSHNCKFCGGRDSPMLRRIRARSTGNIVEELDLLYQTYGYRGFMFYDDELNVSRTMVELMDAIADLQRRRGTEFRLRGFVKAELFDDHQAEAMYRAGFRWLLTGFESGSPRILENIDKRATLEDNTECFRIARKHGLKVKALMSIAHPGESRETVRETEDWLRVVRPDDFDVTIITTYPGSPYYDHAVESEPGIWTYTCPKSGDRLHAYSLDYTTVADYYKGSPDGGYRAYVYTDHLSSDELVVLRDSLESRLRAELGIPFNPSAAAINYEHSMGQLPANILRTSTPSSSVAKLRLPVLG